MTRIFDSKTWRYVSAGVYDAKNNTLKITVNFTGSSPDNSIDQH